MYISTIGTIHGKSMLKGHWPIFHSTDFLSSPPLLLSLPLDSLIMSYGLYAVFTHAHSAIQSLRTHVINCEITQVIGLIAMIQDVHKYHRDNSWQKYFKGTSIVSSLSLPPLCLSPRLHSLSRSHG